MPDLLTHVLFAYSFATLLGQRVHWIEREYVTLFMAGALIPDVSKAYLVVGEATVKSVIGQPFEWYGIHTLGGILVVSALVATWVDWDEVKPVLLMAFGGGLSHLLLDSFIQEPTGYSYAALWPITYHRVPSAGLYISTDVWPVVAAACLATTTCLLVHSTKETEIEH